MGWAYRGSIHERIRAAGLQDSMKFMSLTLSWGVTIHILHDFVLQYD